MGHASSRPTQGQGPREEPTLVARMWRVNLEQPGFPPSHTGIARSLCASGGGARAMSYNLGVYRALYDLGLLMHLARCRVVLGRHPS